jgi:saccharopine dehydrogenase-like NADP-dependent oxidoreductase
VKAALVGLGAVGRRAGRVLAADPTFDRIVIVHRDPRRIEPLVQEWGDRVEVRRGGASDAPGVDVTVLALPSGHRRAANAALDNGSHVICASDEPADIRALMALDAQARSLGRTVAIGTVMAPGLSCLLATHLRSRVERVEEVHVASVGTGGPACARRHHSALTGIAVDWEDGEWRKRPGGSGRELVWFPEPVGGADCYRASLSDPFLLVPAFAECRRVTSRLKATRRDRLTSWMPMLRPPHPEGLLGAVRVEVRGWKGGQATTLILGAAVPPAEAAGAVTARAAIWAATGQMARSGAAGLAELVPSPGPFLRDLAEDGITVSAFEGQNATGV